MAYTQTQYGKQCKYRTLNNRGPLLEEAKETGHKKREGERKRGREEA